MKASSKYLYDFIVEKTGDKQLAKESVLLSVLGPQMYKANAKAQEFGENLMPDICLTILADVYGKRLTKNPGLLESKVYDLMRIVEGSPDKLYIKELVRDYLEA